MGSPRGRGVVWPRVGEGAEGIHLIVSSLLGAPAPSSQLFVDPPAPLFPFLSPHLEIQTSSCLKAPSLELSTLADRGSPPPPTRSLSPLLRAPVLRGADGEGAGNPDHAQLA